MQSCMGLCRVSTWKVKRLERTFGSIRIGLCLSNLTASLQKSLIHFDISFSSRMSGLWGPQSSLDLYLQEEGITTLLMSGVNADQCVLGTLVDSYYRGYDVVLVQDATATTSPEGGYANVCWNVGNVSNVFVSFDDVERYKNGLVAELWIHH